MKDSDEESVAEESSGAEIRNMNKDLARARLEGRDNFRTGERSEGTFRATEEQSEKFRDIFMTMNRNVDTNLDAFAVATDLETTLKLIAVAQPPAELGHFMGYKYNYRGTFRTRNRNRHPRRANNLSWRLQLRKNPEKGTLISLTVETFRVNMAVAMTLSKTRQARSAI